MSGFEPVVARSRTFHTAAAPSAHNCAKLIFVRAGSAILRSKFGVQHARIGDVIALGSNTLFGYEPEGFVTVTTLYLDRDYLIDQVFWQHATKFSDRLEASEFFDLEYTEPAQFLRLGEDRAGLLMPWLDDLVALSVDGLSADRFYRAQSLLSAILDVVVPHLNTTGRAAPSAHRNVSTTSTFRHHAFRSSRPEAIYISELLTADLSRRWSASELAEAVHLSTSQLRRVFTEAFGKPPLAYLTKLRSARMAELLRETETSVSEIAAEVGWSDPDFASRQFRRNTGVSPSEYRRSTRNGNSSPDPE